MFPFYVREERSDGREPLLAALQQILWGERRYYVCVKAHQRGWAQCETRCVSAPALESAVLEQIRGITGPFGSQFGEVVSERCLFERIYAPLTASWPKPSAANSTDSTSASATIWMRSCTPLASRLPRDHPQREQNSRWGPYNGK